MEMGGVMLSHRRGTGSGGVVLLVVMGGAVRLEERTGGRAGMLSNERDALEFFRSDWMFLKLAASPAI